MVIKKEKKDCSFNLLAKGQLLDITGIFAFEFYNCIQL